MSTPVAYVAAIWYCPVDDMAMLYHFANGPAGVVCGVQVKPALFDVYIVPPNTAAL